MQYLDKINKNIKKRSYQYAIVLLLIAILIFTLLQNAWLSDDSFITLVQVLNLHHGDGLVFNFSQRVDAFTHPTWFALIALTTYISGEYYYTIIILSIVLSLASMLLLYTYALKYYSFFYAIVAVLLLLFSKSFIDFSTSGLENPLSFLLFGTVLYMLLPHTKLSKKGLWVIYLLLTLLFLNRMDYALILLPVWIYLLREHRSSNLYPLGVSISIILGWFLFSLLYFGHIFPNTYYAKLHTGFPITDYIQRGLLYFKAELFNDPLSLLIILISLFLSIKRGGMHRAFAIGAVFYMLYFFKTGGDFMQGRYFAILVYISTFLLLDTMQTKRVFTLSMITFLIALLLSNAKTLPPFSDQKYSNREIADGIADERGFYYQKYGLLSANRNWPNIAYLTEKKPQYSTVVCADLGAKALAYRDIYYFIDYCALSDPLLSRLPAIAHPKWRIGHQVRKIPIGYDKAVIDSNSSLLDKQVDLLYKDVHQITASKTLFTTERLKAIYRLNFKNYKIDKQKFMHYDITEAPIDQSVYNFRILKEYQTK